MYKYVGAAVVVTLIVAFTIVRWSISTGPSPVDLGPTGHGTLGDCSSLRNCVSSDADPGRNYVPPIQLGANTGEDWRRLGEIVESLPRSAIIKRTPDYLHVEVRTPIIPFVDDLELLLRPDSGTVAVRSASRVGNDDLGVNRRRVEAVRSAFAQAIEMD